MDTNFVSSYSPVSPINLSDELFKGQDVIEIESPNPSSGSSDFKSDHAADRRPLEFCQLLKAWRWEVFTWALGSVSLALIFVLLFMFRDQTLQQWKSMVQISTMVGALAQVAHSALLVSVSSCVGQLKWAWLRRERRMTDVAKFDDATRGPMGSFMLLLGLNPWSVNKKRVRQSWSQIGNIKSRKACIEEQVRTRKHISWHLLSRL